MGAHGDQIYVMALGIGDDGFGNRPQLNSVGYPYSLLFDMACQALKIGASVLVSGLEAAILGQVPSSCERSSCVNGEHAQKGDFTSEGSYDWDDGWQDLLGQFRAIQRHQDTLTGTGLR